MVDRLYFIIVNEGGWLTFSMGFAGVSAAWLLLRSRGASPLDVRVGAAMNLAGGVTIGLMALGHLLAVSVKLAAGTLREGSLLIFAAIGISLLVPAVMVIWQTRQIVNGRDTGNRTTALNAWLAGTLLVLGLHNLPLAAPALFTIAYQHQRQTRIRWAVVGLALAFTVGLFAASLVFFASGQSFEQFSGIE